MRTAVCGASGENFAVFSDFCEINSLRKNRVKARRMLICKGNFGFVQVSWRFWGELMKIPHTAPQTAEISLAKQQPAKVQLNCPDFDNGMKTICPNKMNNLFYLMLNCPDFDNGMKTFYATSVILVASS